MIVFNNKNGEEIMLTIKKLSKELAKQQRDIQAVADIEAMIQLADAWNYESITDLLMQDSVKLLIVTSSASNIIGYCLYQVIFEQAEILRIGTHPDYQRQGIASQLLIALNNELKANNVNSLLLEVREDNSPAIALYEQQGFTVIHRRKGYYQQPQQPAIDALIMQLNYS